MYSTDDGETFHVLQNCVRTATESNHELGKEFRQSMGAKVVHIIIICGKKWLYYNPKLALDFAPGILLKKRRELERAAAPTGAASSHEICEMSQDLVWDEPQDETDEALLWYEKAACSRDALAEEARADAGV